MIAFNAGVVKSTFVSVIISIFPVDVFQLAVVFPISRFAVVVNESLKLVCDAVSATEPTPAVTLLELAYLVHPERLAGAFTVSGVAEPLQSFWVSK